MDKYSTEFFPLFPSIWIGTIKKSNFLPFGLILFARDVALYTCYIYSLIPRFIIMGQAPFTRHSRWITYAQIGL